MKRIFIYFLLFALLPNLMMAQSSRWRRLLDAPTFDVAVNPLNYNTIFAGGENRLVYRSYDGGFHWDTLIVGYRGTPAQFNNLLIHPIDTNVVIIGGLNFGDLRRCDDHGATDSSWKIVILKKRSISLNGKAMEIKPDDPNYIYLGDFMEGGIFRSTDRGLTWDSLTCIRKLKTMADSNGVPFDTMVHVQLASIQIRHDSTNILVAGTTSGDVFISTDGGFNWNFTDSLVVGGRPSLDPADCEITRIAFSDRDPRVGFACITYIIGDDSNEDGEYYPGTVKLNTPNGGIFKTTDGGYNWDGAAFPDTSFWAVACRGYQNSEEVFAGGYTEAYTTLYPVPGNGIVRRSQDGGSTWVSYDKNMDWYLQSPHLSAIVHSIYGRPDTVLFAVGEHGFIYRYNFTAQWWINVINNLNFNAYSSFFLNDSAGFMAGEGGNVFKTTDKGKNWTQINVGVNSTIHSIYFFDDSKGCVFGDGGTIRMSSDGGNTWFPLNSGTTENIVSGKFYDPDFGYGITDQGSAVLTENGGLIWGSYIAASGSKLSGIGFANKNIGFAVGNNGVIVKTSDGGKTWNKLVSGTDKNLNGLDLIDMNTAFAVGDDLTVLKTTDGGVSWINKMAPTGTNLFCAFFFDKNTGFVTGDKQTILKTTNGGETWLSTLRGSGYKSKIWSQRYFGPKGSEKLYMASEAGLFVLDEPSPVDEEHFAEDPNSCNLTVYPTSDNTLQIYYHKLSANP
ncbi:MAG: hypothetical protein QG635_1126, partial [Bacteroidota bacterium]|nr:hypothetical protein [Bacteroidota bacterium]